MAQDFLEYDKDYKFTSNPLNPHLYELRVKDQYGNFEGVNLFFKLATHEPKSYENINLSFDNPNGLGNFNGLVIEPATTDTIVEIDLSSKMRIQELKENKALTLLVKDSIQVNRTDNLLIAYNQEDKIVVDKFYANIVDNFILLNHQQTNDQKISLTMAHNSTISLHNETKSFEALMFNETGEVKLNLDLYGSKKEKRPIRSIYLTNDKFACVDKKTKEVSLELTGSDLIYLNDCEIECGNEKSVITGNIGKLDLKKILLQVRGSLTINANEVSLRHDNNQASAIYRVHEFKTTGDNTINAKVLRSISQSVRLENCNINMPNGELEFNNKKGEGLVDLRDFICDDSSVRGLAMTIFLSRNSSFIANSSMDNAPMPLMSGKILESIIFNCIAGDNQISKGIAELNIYNKSEAIKNSKKFEGATFEPLSITWITAKSDYPIDVLFKNCLFKGQKNDIELEHLNFKAISSEFNDTYIEARGKLGKNDEAKMGNLSLENSIFSGHNEICAIEDSKISSSTIKDTFLSGVSLVENSSMDKFKSMKDVYKDFNSDVKIEPAPKEVGVINNEIEVL
nr:MAG TPA: hypothetical protein [Caudoviricetes sp.]